MQDQKSVWIRLGPNFSCKITGSNGYQTVWGFTETEPRDEKLHRVVNVMARQKDARNAWS